MFSAPESGRRGLGSSPGLEYKWNCWATLQNAGGIICDGQGTSGGGSNKSSLFMLLACSRRSDSGTRRNGKASDKKERLSLAPRSTIRTPRTGYMLQVS